MPWTFHYEYLCGKEESSYKVFSFPRRFAAPVGMSEEEQEQRQIYKKILEYEQDAVSKATSIVTQFAYKYFSCQPLDLNGLPWLMLHKQDQEKHDS